MDIARSVIGECLTKGVREFVVCSGARNIPLISALLKCEDVVVWSHFEERAAGFYALGRMMDTREPCAVITTSGTAVAELLPAVVECHYQGRPLLVISADRPSEYRGSGAPQAIQQVGIFGDYVGGCEDVEAEAAVLFSGWNGKIPWHVNVCLGEDCEELDAECGALDEVGEWNPEREKINVSSLVRFFDDVWQGVVVFLGGLEPEDRADVFDFLKTLKIPVVADPTSGLRELLGDLCLADPDKVLKKAQFAKVLRIGDVPVGRFWRDLEKLPQVEILNISRTGFSGLARKSETITGSISRIIKGIGGVDEVGDVTDILNGNGWRVAQIDELLERFPDSEPSFVRMTSIYATMAESVYLGNSLPIREWGLFAQRDKDVPHELVRANRGANGIDGQLATWAGWTHGIHDAWILIGDLTALYDLSAPSLLHDCEAEGRVIVVMNNGGGRIFDRLPRVQKMDGAQKGIIANEHAFSFESWAMMWGWDYQRVENVDELEIEAGEAPLVVELVPCEKQTQAFWEAYEKLNN
ncbi:MAG: 2-succinyl-5-enolpyruvyl-6-hydroxy-3-cyclohexene-1-carboxylic-acid synthase [Akkermansiaceae bacterium]